MAETLTVIQRPLLNLPAILTPGDTLSIEADAPATTGEWRTELRRGPDRLALRLLAAHFDPGGRRWRLSALLEAPAPDSGAGLYDLLVTASGGVDDTARHAVQVIRAFPEAFLFVHLTDPHLPTHRYHDEPGAQWDSSAIVDLRAVIEDINLIHPAFVLLTGDLVNEGELEDYLDRRYYTRAQRVLMELAVPLYLTAGNHDLGGWPDTPPPAGTARRTWWRFFGWRYLDAPRPTEPWCTQNASFDYGSLHCVGLEAYANYDGWRSTTYGAASFTAAQLEWLAADLAGAREQAACVLFYHYDFSAQLDLASLGVELALWGHIHRDAGDRTQAPYDLATDNVCDGERAYRIIRFDGERLIPHATVRAGLEGENLRVTCEAIGEDPGQAILARIENRHPLSLPGARVRVPLAGQVRRVAVDGGRLVRLEAGEGCTVCEVAVDLAARTVHVVRVTADPDDPPGEPAPDARPLLAQNEPNPFRRETRLRFTLSRACRVRLSVMDLVGRRAGLLFEGFRGAGPHMLFWNGQDAAGRPVPAGAYWLLLEGAGGRVARRLVRVR